MGRGQTPAFSRKNRKLCVCWAFRLTPSGRWRLARIFRPEGARRLGLKEGMPEAVRRRVSSSSSSREPPRESSGEASLQLAIARDGVGLELSGPVGFGAVGLAAANAQVMGVAFPLDVSGGVER